VGVAWLVLLLGSAVGGCNSLLGNDPWTLESTPVVPGGSDASDASDEATRRVDSAPGPDTSTRDATTRESAAPFDATASSDTAVSPPGTDSSTGLDPCLVLPSPDAAPCSPLGSEGACGLGACLIASTGPEGRCQMCQPSQGECSGHANAPCNVVEDCDIGWACYCHACTLFCALATPQTCGASTCTSVGNATEGVCLPPN
jgi:hypothetical protein